jgi:ATP-dependent helicase/nuclease subunit B
MSLQFIYGRAGTGKSELCLKKIKEIIKQNNPDTKIFIIVPEQFSYAEEKKLLNMLESKSVINAEVISFKRIANRIFTEVRWEKYNTSIKSRESYAIK